MKLLIGIKCWWQGDWIEYVLRSVYDVAHQIRIAHGPVKPMYAAGFKNDDTVEKITAFPDPQKKIKLFDNLYWETITEMVRTTMEGDADFYLKMDGDEVPTSEWLQEFMSLVPRALEEDKAISSNYWHCIGDFKHVIDDWKLDEYRLRGFPIKRKVYFTHPDFVWPYFHCIDAPSIRMQRRINHYNWLRNKNAVMVHRAYQVLNWHGWSLEKAQWELKFEPDFEKGIIQNMVTTWQFSEKSDLIHPEVVKQHPYWPDGVKFDQPTDWGKLLKDA